MKTKRIVPGYNLSWKTRLATFASSFGIIWLFIEPLFAVNISLMPTWGSWRYIILLIVAGFVTVIIEYINRRRLINRMKFIRLEIVSTQNGTRHLVEAPQDILIKVFIELLLDSFSSELTSKSLLAHRDIYTPTLLVERTSTFEELSSNKTLIEAGLKDGDVCRVRANIREGFEESLYRGQDKF